VAVSAGGQAQCSTAALTVAGSPHAITAEYRNGANFSDSDGTLAGGQTVNKADSLSTVTNPVNPSVFGQSVTFTATVTAVAPGAGTPSGTIDFKDGATTIASGVLLNGSGVATFATSSLSVGPHSITAVYSGDGNFNATGVGGSTAPVFTQNVDKADTAFSDLSGPTICYSNTPTVLSGKVIVVAPGAGTPTGNVSITLNGVTPYTITYNYAGDPNFNGVGPDTSKQLTVTALSFTGFLPPIDGGDATGGDFYHPVRSFKLGSTIPVKFMASSCGSPFLTGIHTLRATKYGNATTSDPPMDATPTDAATTGNQFRLTDSQWHFNMSTKGGTGFSAGTWLIEAMLADGSTHYVWIAIKK
jgi:hypothetical protein